MLKNIDIPKDKINEFCKKWNIKELALFGSVLTDNFRDDSDIDILVLLSESCDISLFDWVDMIDELKNIFNRKIDLVEKTTIKNPIRRKNILNYNEVIYEAA